MDSPHFLARPSVYRCGLAFARYFPSFILYFITDRLAELSYLIYKNEKANVKSNIRKIFPDLPETNINKIAFRIFKNYGRYLSDYGKFLGGDRSFITRKFVVFEGEDNLQTALQMKRGIILLTAHLGNWELGGVFFGKNDIKTNVVTLKDQDADINFFRTWYRKANNVNTISIGDSPFAALDLISAINRNEIVAMLIDRYEMNKGGIEVKFFGSKTYLPIFPFWLSKLTQSPILPAFVVREGKGYRGILDRPLIITNENEISPAAHKIVDIFEKYIKKYPDQWYNFIPL